MKYSVPLLLILLVTGCKQAQVPIQVKNDIDSIVNQSVPDKREAVCDLDLELISAKTLMIRGETSIPELKSEILRYFSNSGIEFADSLKVLPDPSEIANKWGLVSVCICNMKKDPSHSGELVSQAIMGTPVGILKESGSWLLVQTPDHYIGWITASSVSMKDENEFAEWKQSDRLIFTSKSGDILSEESGNDVVSDAVAGVIVKKISAGGNYFIVELPDGRRGRLNKKDALDFGSWCDEITPDAGKLIGFAKSMTGTSYLWGGTSTKMADCSGFMKTVYFSGGIILARDASQQFLYGNEVDISSSFDALQSGDLLFFGSLNEKGEKRITHTGMFTGDKEFIHSSVTNGMVWTNSLDSTRSGYNSYLVEILLGAKRIIGTESEKGIEHIAKHNWYR